MPLPFYNYFIILSCLASISVFFQRRSPRYLKLFPYFLLLTFLVEIGAHWLESHTGTNVILYNIYTIIQFSFYFFVLKEIILSEINKKRILYIIAGFVLFALINILFGQKWNDWNSITYALGSLVTVTIIIYYFFELFRRPKATDLKKDPAFWICTGLLFFCCCSFPIFGLSNFLLNAPRVIIRNLEAIIIILNSLLYSLFTIAFFFNIDLKKADHKKAVRE